MQRAILGFLLLLLPAAAEAQSYGYGFLGSTLGSGSTGGAFRYGLGGEARTSTYLGLGGEVGGIAKHGNGALLSGNASVHIPVASDRRFDPFATVGGTFASLGGDIGVYLNLGGGLNYWFRDRFGLRFEFRGYAGAGDLNNFSEFRFGVTFR